MIRGQDIPNDRLYKPEHIHEVLTDMTEGFEVYFQKIVPDKTHLVHVLKESVEKFEHERGKYIELLDRAYLEEFEYDPGSFKGTLRRDCPIIRRCLNSPAKVMDAYRKGFNQASGEDMLEVVINLSGFVDEFIAEFNPGKQLKAKHPSELGVSDLDTETYTTFGVIGGGIRSHIIYNLHPIAFPSRSQNSIWSYYFITHQKDYGFEDGSEFLMINSDGVGTQQNFFYPYDLFTYYAGKIFLLLKEKCLEYDYPLKAEYRYVYVNAFFDGVANLHSEDINALKPFHEQFDY